MSRRRLALALVLATAGIAIGVTIALAAPARRHTPPINVRAMPQACFVTHVACSLQPCVEFVAPARSRAPGMRCTAYPSPRGRTVFVRR